MRIFLTTEVDTLTIGLAADMLESEIFLFREAVNNLKKG